MGQRSKVNRPGRGRGRGWQVLGSWGPPVNWGEVAPSKGDTGIQPCPWKTCRSMGPVLPHALIFFSKNPEILILYEKVPGFENVRVWQHVSEGNICFIGFQFSAPVLKVQVTSYLHESWLEKERHALGSMMILLDHICMYLYGYVYIYVCIYI